MLISAKNLIYPDTSDQPFQQLSADTDIAQMILCILSVSSQNRGYAITFQFVCKTDSSTYRVAESNQLLMLVVRNKDMF